MPALFQKRHRLGVAGVVERADIGAEGVTEIDKRRSGDDLGVGDRGSGLARQFERTADLHIARDLRGAALREGILALAASEDHEGGDPTQKCCDENGGADGVDACHGLSGGSGLIDRAGARHYQGGASAM